MLNVGGPAVANHVVRHSTGINARNIMTISWQLHTGLQVDIRSSSLWKGDFKKFARVESDMEVTGYLFVT